MNKLCAEFSEIANRLEDVVLTPMERGILFELMCDIEDRLESVKRLDAMVKRRIEAESRDNP